MSLRTVLPDVDMSTEYGRAHPMRMRLPIFAGALGSKDVARMHWDGLAAGAAVCGISLVVGENVCGVDPELEVDGAGRVVCSPEMERRVRLYRQWNEGYGEIVVQMGAEDARLGVAEYVVQRLGVESIELKWGRKAKCVKTGDLARAVELRRRGYVVIPNPESPAMQAAFRVGAIREFEVHGRRGFVDEEGFLRSVESLRELGVKRILLKSGAASARELMLTMKWSSQARVDLLTIDAVNGGAAPGPGRIAQESSRGALDLRTTAGSYAQKLAARGAWVSDLALAGDFLGAAQIFGILSQGGPGFRAVCLGRAGMIASVAGDDLETMIRHRLLGQGEPLPRGVDALGARRDEVWASYEALQERFGAARMKRLPFGAIAMCAFVDKLKAELAQLMSEARRGRLGARGER